MPFVAPAARFEIPSEDVRLLKSAVEFRDVLLEKLEGARSRCILTSLYLGAEQKKIYNLIVKKASEGLQVWTMTDYLRTLRPDRLSRTDSFDSSADSMLNAVRASGAPTTTWKTYLYLSPCSYGWQRWFPYRMQETLGVLHWKFYIFDDDVIITGANLAHSYLTNRHDRWMLIRNAKGLCDSLIKLGELWHPCCYQLHLDNQKHLSDQDISVKGVKQLLYLSKPTAHRDQCLRAIEFYLATIQEFKLDCDPNASRTLTNIVRLSIGIHCGYAPEDCTLTKTEPEFVVKALRGPGVPGQEHSAVKRPELIMATPYPNFSPDMISLLKAEFYKDETLCIVGPCPSASSFYNGGPVTSAIPFAYVMLTVHALTALKQSISVKYRSFLSHTECSTFHAKGIWHISADREENAPVGTGGARALTIAGSTNFGLRSQARDLECLFLVDTADPRLVSAFKEETTIIRKLSKEDTLDQLNLLIYRMAWITYFIARFFSTNPFFKSLL